MRRDFARTLAVAAIGCFIASLLLPALDLMLFGKPLTIRGWQATAAGFDLLTKASEPRGFALGASAVANLVFLAAPWLAWGAPGRRAAMAFAVATLAGLLLALAAPHLLDRAPVLRPGYPIWIAAYALLLAGWMRRARRAASISSDESVS